MEWVVRIGQTLQTSEKPRNWVSIKLTCTVEDTLDIQPTNCLTLENCDLKLNQLHEDIRVC